jgi:hypothetical protein
MSLKIELSQRPLETAFVTYLPPKSLTWLRVFVVEQGGVNGQHPSAIN